MTSPSVVEPRSHLIQLWPRNHKQPPPQYGQFLPFHGYLLGRLDAFHADFTGALLVKFLHFREIYHARAWEAGHSVFTTGHKGLDQPFQLLWQLFSDDPETLGAMIADMAIPIPKNGPKYGPHVQAFAGNRSTQLTTQLLYPFGSTEDDALASNRVFLEYIDRARSSTHDLNDVACLDYINKDDLYLSPSWKNLAKDVKSDFDQQLLDVDRILKEYLQRQTPGKDTNSPCHSEVDLVSVLDGIKNKHLVTLTNGSREPKLMSLLLFAVSGSGKTQSIKSLLSRKFGLYFQACNLPFHNQGLHGPKRLEGSADVATFWKLYQYLDTVSGDARSAIIMINLYQKYMGELIDCRYIVLGRFLTIAKDMEIPPESLPMLWFDLQITSESEPFDELFQISVLLRKVDVADCPVKRYGSIRLDDEMDFAKKAIKDYLQGARSEQTGLYLCLDEAQSDLETPIASRPEMARSTMLHAWTHMLQRAQTRISTSSQPLILAGTSLNLQKVLDAANLPSAHPQMGSSGKPEPWGQNTIVFSNFPLVKSRAGVLRLMAENGTTSRIERFCNATYQADEAQSRISSVTEAILAHGEVLRGRPCWMVLYLQRLNRLLDSRRDLGHDMEDEIEEQSSATRKEVMQDLVSRLQKLKKHTTLMHSLCWVVIRSDLLDRPTAFADHDAGQTMICEAFASTKAECDGSSKARLEERLAVEVAKTFFTDTNEMRGIVEKELQEFMNLQQNDVSCFGKSAEWFLAWRLYGALRDSENRLAGSQGADRLDQIMDEMSKAVPLNDNANLSLDLSGYTLVSSESGKIGHMYNKTIEIPKWMEGVRQCRDIPAVAATFYFPENEAGPDLLFALRKRTQSGVLDPKSTVLCAIQLKCGETELGKGERCTDLAQAYNNRKTHEVLDGYKAKRGALDTALKEWSKCGLRILRVLFTAAVSERKWVPRVAPRAGTSCLEYFIRLDKERTELLFGYPFQRILEAVRSSKSSLAGLYLYDDDQDAPPTKKRRKA